MKTNMIPCREPGCPNEATTTMVDQGFEKVCDEHIPPGVHRMTGADTHKSMLAARDGWLAAIPIEERRKVFENEARITNDPGLVEREMIRIEAIAEETRRFTLDTPVRVILDVLKPYHVTQYERATRQEEPIEFTELVAIARLTPIDAPGGSRRLSVTVDGTGPASTLEAYVRLAEEVRKARI